MRMTLTIDDDLAAFLRNKATREDHSIKAVVNDLLRAGIAVGDDSFAPRKRIKIIAKPLVLKPGYDPRKFNQLADELEEEPFLNK